MKNNISTIWLIPVLILCQVIISCNPSKDKEFTKIKKERDSLRVLMAEIDQKYVFDSIRLVFDSSKENLLIPGSEYNLEFYFIGFNNDSYFKIGDNLNKASEDSLFPERGVFHYRTLLQPNENEFKGFISTNSKYGKNYEAVLHNPDLLEK